MQESVDVILRARHSALLNEFVCLSTELRVVKTEPGSRYPRSIEAFCMEPRAEYFARRLTSFEESCASCAFCAPRPYEEALVPVAEP